MSIDVVEQEQHCQEYERHQPVEKLTAKQLKKCFRQYPLTTWIRHFPRSIQKYKYVANDRHVLLFIYDCSSLNQKKTETLDYT